VTEAIPTYDADTALTKLIKLLGPPPLLRNENFDDFKEVFAELFAALGPEDFLMEVQVYHLAIETRLIFRLTRYEAAQLNQLEKDQRLSKKLRKVSDAIIVGTDTPLGATSDVVGLIAPGDHDGRAS